ncbi:hypothetical protein P3T36_007048 [Kitasatospora sp. MAP12-15]|uniref:hypothetical protein n=1 Tax=unclassified Kitasatospora TaxID=2633591 RepID=UPI002476BA23|nr:hypothetical protein [Kitasatospora sp. MAP12-44]MDH6108111.1 hypothetical protein [Kitasatospora sp. MAP12-44]
MPASETGALPRPVVFVHTNDEQLLAARVAAHSLKLRSAQADAFEVRLLRVEETPRLHTRLHGRQIRYAGELINWNGRTFSPLRLLVPQIMGYRGTALVLDPDIVAVGDVAVLLQQDMAGKAIWCRERDDWEMGVPARVWSTSVMLLDCRRLSHWRWDTAIEEVRAGRLDMLQWLRLADEAPETIGRLPEEWNHLDTLTDRTRLLHYTDVRTQPWRSGLPLDYELHSLGAAAVEPRVHRPHPDQRQESLFFELLRSALECGDISAEFVEAEIRARRVRPDVFELVRAVRRAP